MTLPGVPTMMWGTSAFSPAKSRLMFTPTRRKVEHAVKNVSNGMAVSYQDDWLKYRAVEI